MAHPGHNGQQRGDNGVDTSQYIFNPMAYNYHQNQNFSPPTVLSQQDANVMADFFENPNNANPDDSYLAFNFDDENTNTTTAAASANDQSAQTSTNSNFNGNMAARPAAAFASYEFSDLFMPIPQQPTQQSAGDAVAGASALLGLSTSQEQSNLLNASNYMTWGNIVGAQAIQQSPARSANLAEPVRGQPVKSNSTSQLRQAQLSQNPANSWADIQNQAFQSQRTRHTSLQLDTNTQFPSHQQGWQQSPQSAFPHVANRSRPPLAKFGSDSHFSPHGYTAQNSLHTEDKQNNLMQLAMAGSAPPNSSTNNMHRHSVTGISPVTHRTHSTPAHLGRETQSFPIDPSFGSKQYNPNRSMPTLKRKASHIDDDMQSAPPNLKHSDSFEATQSVPASNQPRQNGHQQNTVQQLPDASLVTDQTDVTQASQTAVASRGRKVARTEKSRRENLSEFQKRANHIQSEQKRRDAMKTNYSKLGVLVPGLGSTGAGSSRSEMLVVTADHLESTRNGNIAIARLLGISIEDIDAEADTSGRDGGNDGSGAGNDHDETGN